MDMPYDILDRRVSSVNEGLHAPAALLLRRLPPNTTTETLKTLLLFSHDLQNLEIVSSEHESDQDFTTAVARFATLTGASAAQGMLDGKPNMDSSATMVVELITGASNGSVLRRNTMDPSVARVNGPAASSAARSRFTGVFGALDALSPPAIGPPSSTGLSDDGKSPSGTFASRSPPSQVHHELGRFSGKTVIDEELGEEDTVGLLTDPLTYMKNDTRRRNIPRVPLTAFGNLALNTNLHGVRSNDYASPRSNMGMHSPHMSYSPGSSVYTGNQFLRHNYPPANPADQNPPCNTLYVGNLPMDTSEDELKAMFSKQRGYRRLCFRTKQKGPMCFVEFEDVSFATKALHELYGAQLHNSVKGGIRLSFSKNPLGVRSGQPGSGLSPSAPMSPLGAGPMGGLLGTTSPGSYPAVSRPPPGLSAPPGFGSHAGGTDDPFAHQGLELSSPGGVATMRSPAPGARSGTNKYPDYLMGK